MEILFKHIENTLTAHVPNFGSTRIASQIIGSFLPLNGWIAYFPWKWVYLSSLGCTTIAVSPSNSCIWQYWLYAFFSFTKLQNQKGNLKKKIDLHKFYTNGKQSVRCKGIEVNQTTTQRIYNERKAHLAIIVKSNEKRVQKWKSGNERMEREKKKWRHHQKLPSTTAYDRDGLWRKFEW